MNALNPLSPDKRDAERKAYEPSMEEILASIRRIIADDQAFGVKQNRESEPQIETSSSIEPEQAIAPEAEISVPPPSASFPNELPREAIEPTVKVETSTPMVNAGSEAEATPAATPLEIPAAAPVVASAATIEPIGTMASATFPVEGQFHAFKTAAAPAAEPGHVQAMKTEPMATKLNAADSAAKASPSYSPPPLEHAHVSEPLPLSVAEGSDDDGLPLVSPETNAAVSVAFDALIASRVLPSGDALNEMVRDIMRPMLKAWLDDNLPVLVERLVRAEIERVARGGR
jgi:cell pole-organizing protein PopZ